MSHEGAMSPLLRGFRALRKQWSLPSYRRDVKGKIRAPPTNAVLTVPATLSWEGHQYPVQAMIDSSSSGDFLDLYLAKELKIPTQLLPHSQATTTWGMESCSR